MPTVTIDGATFNYAVAGEENKRTIFTLHGGRGAGDHKSDFATYSRLADEYRVISFDQRGHGKSSETPPFTFNQLADDVELMRKHFCGDDQCIVIGGSFGGFIALTYAVRHPGSYSHLVLRGTAPSFQTEVEAIEIMKERAHRVPSLTPEMIDKLFSDRVESDLEFRLIWLAMQPLYSENFNAQAAFERTRDMDVHVWPHNDLYKKEEWEQWDVRPQLDKITAPTFIMVGENDWICPPSQSQAIKDGIPHAELHVVPDANHAVHAQKSEVVLPLLRTFLKT